MRIYFIGIGGAGIGPLALMAHQAGYEVIGSDTKVSSYTKYLNNKGIKTTVDQSGKDINKLHKLNKIDWVVGVSAIIRDNPNHPELKFAKDNGIKISERDELLNKIIFDNELKLIAVAGTHGKTTTTAMIIWLMQNLNMPISYSVGAKLSFGDMSKFSRESDYFIYECDEFHKNFLHFNPYISAITGIAWDHHEIFDTEKKYNDSFVDFLNQSANIIIFNNDAKRIEWINTDITEYLDMQDEKISAIKLAGKYFRQDAWLAINTVKKLCNNSIEELIELINKYPGSSRRMERIADNLYSDYAHTPEKINGCITTAKEMLREGQKLVIVYEPLTNRRQYYIKDSYNNLFKSVDKLYWVPSYLAREDKNQKVLSPKELINEMTNKQVAEPAKLDGFLWESINNHLKNNDFVVLISGGGGGSLDEWAREKLKS
jgi:UDP-N-acetylmuramate--alanine ligase